MPGTFRARFGRRYIGPIWDMGRGSRVTRFGGRARRSGNDFAQTLPLLLRECEAGS